MKKVLLGIGLLISFFVIRHYTLQRVWDFDIYENYLSIASLVYIRHLERVYIKLRLKDIWKMMPYCLS
jgi:hypothetical protein